MVIGDMQNKKSIIFDWDCTLAEPRSREFFAIHQQVTQAALAEQYELPQEKIAEIREDLGAQGRRFEEAFFAPDVQTQFNLAAPSQGKFKFLHKNLSSINPEGHFERDESLVASVRALKDEFDLYVLSNSPRELIDKIAAIVGYETEKDFKACFTMSAENGPPKFISAENAFKQILHSQAINPSSCWSLGDSAKTDIKPAQALGLNTILIDNIGSGNGGIHIADALKFLQNIPA
jgi:FMN phosphatase YigB (HAD superfamily)